MDESIFRHIFKLRSIHDTDPSQWYRRWWQLTDFFNFHPENWGRFSQIWLAHILQMGDEKPATSIGSHWFCHCGCESWITPSDRGPGVKKSHPWKFLNLIDCLDCWFSKKYQFQVPFPETNSKFAPESGCFFSRCISSWKKQSLFQGLSLAVSFRERYLKWCLECVKARLLTRLPWLQAWSWLFFAKGSLAGNCGPIQPVFWRSAWNLGMPWKLKEIAPKFGEIPQKERIVFQVSFFRGYVKNFGGVSFLVGEYIFRSWTFLTSLGCHQDKKKTSIQLEPKIIWVSLGPVIVDILFHQKVRYASVDLGQRTGQHRRLVTIMEAFQKNRDKIL